MPGAGIPERTPVLTLNRTPEGRAPDSESVGAGNPVEVTAKVPATPAVKSVLLALVIRGGAFTESVKLCVASAPIPLCAVMVMVKLPAVPADGVPLMFAVPLPLLMKFTPAGNAPVSVRIGAGLPDATTVNDPNVPTTKDVLVAVGVVGADGGGGSTGGSPAACPPPPQPLSASPKRGMTK